MKENKGFNQNFIDELKSQNDIVSIISKYVTGNHKGKTWWACCPFHFEKTPSFAVNDIEQYYHCFGCGASGDVISFVQKIESIDFYDACKILADNAGLKMPEFELDGNIAVTKKLKEKYLKILKDTAKHYYSNLSNPLSEPARLYMDKRGLDLATIKTFGIGYSLGWNEVITYLKKLGYSEEDIIGAGVAEKRNNTIFDTYSKRLIFPVINSYGDVVGFSGRVLEKTDFAKYKNTAQTLVFDKSKCVYNINRIKEQKNSGTLKEIILVEGQMDVISLYKNGVKNAVASMGTALTLNHAKEIKRFCDKVVVCYDGDSAGKKATLRSLEILVNAGLRVYVASMEDGVDPDEFILRYGKSSFDNLIESAKYWVEYLIDNFAKNYDLEKPDEKTRFVKDCLNVIKSLTTSAEQDIYLEKVKSITNISLSILRHDLENIENTDGEVTSEKAPSLNQGELKNLDIKKENAYVKAVKFVMASLLHKKPYANINKVNFADYLQNNDYVLLYNYIKKEFENGNKPIISAVFDMFNVEDNADIYDIVNFEFNENSENEKYFDDCVAILINTYATISKRIILEKLAKEKDISARRKLTEKLNELIKAKKK